MKGEARDVVFVALDTQLFRYLQVNPFALSPRGFWSPIRRRRILEHLFEVGYLFCESNYAFPFNAELLSFGIDISEVEFSFLSEGLGRLGEL